MTALLLHLDDFEFEVATRTLTMQGTAWSLASKMAMDRGRIEQAAELNERAEAAERVVIALRTGKHRAIEAGVGQ